MHVAIALVELSEFNYSISEDQMRLIAWGELYKFKEDIISLHSAENKKWSSVTTFTPDVNNKIVKQYTVDYSDDQNKIRGWRELFNNARKIGRW